MDDAIERMDDIKIEHNQFHQLTRELNQKNIELDQLKKILSDSKLAVFEERKLLLHAQSEIDDLKISELADRKKIQYLLMMSTQSVENGTNTYLRQKVPKSIVKETKNGEHSTGQKSFVDMDFIDEKASQLKLNALQERLKEQFITYEVHVKNLKHENSVQISHLQLQNDKLKNQMEETLNENEKLRHISRENMRGIQLFESSFISILEVSSLKKDSKSKERKVMEEKSFFNQEKNDLKTKLVDFEGKYSNLEKV